MLCRKLRCPRNTLHINLFVSFILRAAISFVTDNLLVDGVGLPGDVTIAPNGKVTFKDDGTSVGIG